VVFGLRIPQCCSGIENSAALLANDSIEFSKLAGTGIQPHLCSKNVSRRVVWGNKLGESCAVDGIE
jgi:hypothetical protein